MTTNDFNIGLKKKSFQTGKIIVADMDFHLLILVIFLVIFGSVILFSSSYHRANIISQDYMFFLKKRINWILLSVAVSFFVSGMEISFLKKMVPYVLLFSLLIIALTFIPGVGVSQKGGIRWVSIAGIFFQPSEFVKFSMILYLSYVLERKKENNEGDNFSKFINVIIVIVTFSALIYAQNDLSTAFFVFSISICMLLIGGVQKRFFLFVIFAITLLLVFAILLVPFRMERLKVFLNPSSDPNGSGYQILNSIKSLKNGGIFGKGLGLGSQKLGNLPEVYSDFIFTVVAEELGFIGVVFVFFLFGLLAFKGFKIAYYSPSYFNSFLAFGITASIVLQALLNISVVSGLIPTTGVTLPFFSSGGSSLFVTIIMCSILLNLSRYTEYPK